MWSVQRSDLFNLYGDLYGNLYGDLICPMCGLVLHASAAVFFRLQWVPRLKTAQDRSVRDLRAVKLACPAYTKSYKLPNTGKSNV